MPLIADILIYTAVVLAVCIPLAVVAFSQARQFAGKRAKGLKVIKQPRFLLWMGCAYLLVCFSIMGYIWFSSKSNSRWIGLIVLFTASLAGAALIIYTLCWRIVVTADQLVIHTILRGIKRIGEEEIGGIELHYNGMIAYDRQKRRLFTLESSVDGYNAAYSLLCRWGKIEPAEEVEHLIVKHRKVDGWAGLICATGASGVLAWFVVSRDDVSRSAWIIALLAAFAAFSFYTMFNAIRWRIMAGGGMLYIRRAFTAERRIRISDITRVDMDGTTLRLISGKRRIATVEAVYVGYAALVEILKEEGIPFYAKGKRMDG